MSLDRCSFVLILYHNTPVYMITTLQTETRPKTWYSSTTYSLKLGLTQQYQHVITRRYLPVPIPSLFFQILIRMVLHPSFSCSCRCHSYTRRQHAHHSKCPTNNGHEGSDIIVPMSFAPSVRDPNGTQINNEFGFGYLIFSIQ